MDRTARLFADRRLQTCRFAMPRSRAFAESELYWLCSWVFTVVSIADSDQYQPCVCLRFFQYSWVQKYWVLFCLTNYFVLNYVAKLFSLSKLWNVSYHVYCWIMYKLLMSRGCVLSVSLSWVCIWACTIREDTGFYYTNILFFPHQLYVWLCTSLSLNVSPLCLQLPCHRFKRSSFSYQVRWLFLRENGDDSFLQFSLFCANIRRGLYINKLALSRKRQ